MRRAALTVFAILLTGAAVVRAQDRVFPHPDRIRYDGHCLTVEGKDMVVYSGAFHYFRVGTSPTTPSRPWTPCVEASRMPR